MRLVVVLLLAYLVTAIFYVWRELAQRNPLRKSFFVIKYRQTGDLMGLVVAGMTWPVMLINPYYRRRIRPGEGVTIGVFLGAAIIFWIISD